MRSFLFLVGLLVWPAGAQAAPLVDVRARTRVNVEALERTGSGVHVRGTLIDAGSGEGVTGRDVIITVGSGSSEAPHRVTTGRAGRFDLYVEMEAGRHVVAARFTGDELYGEASFDGRAFDVDRAQLVLDVEVAHAIEATVPVVEVTFTTGSGDGPVSARLRVRAGDASGPGTLRSVGEVTTGEDGTGRLEIPRERLGRPGEKRVLARFEGSDSFNPLEVSSQFLLYTSTQLSDLEVPTGAVAFERDVRASGKLLDAEGKPLSAALVALRQGEVAVVETVTDVKGRFELRSPAARFGPGAHAFSVEHTSTLAWRRGTRSSPFTVDIARPRPVPRWVVALAPALTAAAVLTYLLLRSRPWRRLVEAWRARRRRPESEGARPVGAETAEAVVAPGLILARPTLMSSLRRAADHGFSGRVRDVVRGTPVGGAVLSLAVEGHVALTLHTDASGHFEVELPPGMWRVTVAAHGYVTETVQAPVPHRGELRGARIDLLPVRERVFALYREVAAPLLPRAELWGVWTPREIFDHVRARKPAEALAALTDLVEETTFAERIPDESVVEQTAGAVRAARSELAR